MAKFFSNPQEGTSFAYNKHCVPRSDVFFECLEPRKMLAAIYCDVAPEDLRSHAIAEHIYPWIAGLGEWERAQFNEALRMFEDNVAPVETIHLTLVNVLHTWGSESPIAQGALLAMAGLFGAAVGCFVTPYIAPTIVAAITPVSLMGQWIEEPTDEQIDIRIAAASLIAIPTFLVTPHIIKNMSYDPEGAEAIQQLRLLGFMGGAAIASEFIASCFSDYSGLFAPSVIGLIPPVFLACVALLFPSTATEPGLPIYSKHSQIIFA